MKLLSNRSKFIFCILASACIFFGGCINALRPYNSPSQQKLRVQSSDPRQFTFHLLEKAYSVPADGRVTLDVPRLERGCATYLFGVIKIKDFSPYDIRAIKLKKEGVVTREFSLNDLAKLPMGENGYRIIKIE